MSTSTGARHAGATLTVDLGAICANYRLLRSRLGATDCAAVVKADAYGLGAAAVAPALAAEGCRQFFAPWWSRPSSTWAASPVPGEMTVEWNGA